MLRVEKTVRDAEALRMRAAGLAYEQIGERLGLSTSGSWKAVQASLKAVLTEGVDHLRLLEGLRLDEMQAAVWPKATAGDTTAICSVLKIMERRARLLGLDAPTKIAPTDPTGESAYTVNLPSISDSELIRWAQEHGVTVDSEAEDMAKTG